MSIEYPKQQVSQEFVDHTSNKYENFNLQLPITPSELESLCEGYPQAEKALEQMIAYSVQYANDVWAMKQFVANKADYDDEEWSETLAEIDAARTRLHNALVASIALLLRKLNEEEIDTSWARELAPLGTLERAPCGKFAIMLTYWLAVNRKDAYGS